MGGIFSYSGRVEQSLLSSLGESLSIRGTDGGGDVCSTHVGFSYRVLATNRESRLEDQPFVSPERYVLTWDGRLDNRDELVSLLTDGALARTITDVELVMAAYLRWGESFASHLIGDFALALWDAQSRSVILARDPIGTRTLYYQNNSNRFVWATNLRALVPLLGGSIEIEDEYIAGYLNLRTELHLTPYKRVFAVKPGEMIVVGNDSRMRARRFWAPDPHCEVRYKADADYEEHFTELFAQAVRCRLRSDRTVFAELSGGLDSSSIVCMADRVIAEWSCEARELETVSTVADRSPNSSERRFINMVEAHRGRATNFVREDEFPILSPVTDLSWFWTLNPMINSYTRHKAFEDLMRSKKASVILSGVGGDELIHSTNDPTPELSDLLAGRKLSQLHRRLKLWAPLLRQPYVRLFWKSALLPSLPRRVRERFHPFVNSPVWDWFNPKFVKRFRLRNRRLGSDDVFGYRTPGRRSRSIAFMSAVETVANGERQEVCPFDVAYPYLDRRLVEFLLAVPYEQLVRPGESRSLMRRALKGILPEGIRQRRGKGNPGETVCRALSREWRHLGSLFEDPRVVRWGYMEPKPLREAFARVRLGNPAGSAVLLGVVALEIWLRCVEARFSDVRPSHGAFRSAKAVELAAAS
jgi:asparagine synthase (glutamine-hydrolysing)